MAGNTQPKRVLIVDDEPNVAFVLADSLEKLGEGYSIETANSGEEALTKIREDAYALVVTDYKMPGMSGLDLAQEIRQTAPDTQVVLMTAYGTAELRDSVEHLKLDYLDKPFTMDQIREIVERAVGHTRHSEDPYRAGVISMTEPVQTGLQRLQADTGARCVMLVSSSGYPVETVGQTKGLNVSSVGALVAANFMAAVELAKLLGNTSIFKSSYHEGEDYNIYSYDVNGDLLLAVIFGSESKPGTVWFYTKQTAAALIPLLADLSPSIHFEGDLTAAIDAELLQAFGDTGSNEHNEDALLNLQEAIAAGLVLSRFDQERS